MRVVILGKGLMLANLVLGVKDAGADIVGVFRYEYTTQNRLSLFIKDMLNPAPEVTLLKELGLNQIRLKSANSQEFRNLLISQNVDLVLVGTWKERLKKETFNIPTIGTVNAHPSLLPKYRGPNPYIQTILHGEKETGVTLHLVDEGYDTGAILSQDKIEILDTDTSKEVRDKSVRLARRLVREFINDLNDKMITPIKQSEKRASYFPNISGSERMLDFEFQTSTDVVKTIRALHPFLPCYITYKNNFFIVDPYSVSIFEPKNITAKAGEIIDKSDVNRSITIVCKDGKVIKFSNLKLYKLGFLTKFYIKRFVKITS